eukprot:7918171-Pyramimonas_sp.AAC.1
MQSHAAATGQPRADHLKSISAISVSAACLGNQENNAEKTPLADWCTEDWPEEMNTLCCIVGGP